MGRITVFAIDNCPFCKKAKANLTKMGIEYYEVNLDDYPQKRSDMLKAAKQLSVPQIFVNEIHIGGSSDLEEWIASGKFDEIWAKEKEKADPTLALLQRPDAPPAARPAPSPRKEEVFGSKALVWKDIIPVVEKHLGPGFDGKSLVTFLLRHFELDSREEGLEIAKDLMEAGFLHGSKVADDSSSTLALIKSLNPAALNTFRNWNDRVDDPILVVTNLKKKLGSILNKYRDDDGLVDYLEASKDPEFLEYDESSCEIQKIDVSKMGIDEKKAFCINLYNLMIPHAFTKIGAPKNGLQRSAFFTKVKYNVGGHLYTFDDIESGILRGNRPGPMKFNGPIPPSDPRMNGVLADKDVDNRIHFALNCGAKSCPPVKKFTEEAIAEELDIVARAFFMLPENCSISGNTLTLSKILHWYRRDFGGKNLQVAKTVSQWLSQDKQEKLQPLIDSGNLKVKFAHYDWTNDAKRTVPLQVGSKCVIS